MVSFGAFRASDMNCGLSIVTMASKVGLGRRLDGYVRLDQDIVSSEIRIQEWSDQDSGRYCQWLEVLQSTEHASLTVVGYSSL